MKSLSTSLGLPLAAPAAAPVETTPKMLCHCRQVSEVEVRESITILAEPTVDGVSYLTGAGTGCMACQCRIQRLIDGKPPCGAFAFCESCGTCRAACGCGGCGA